jgi:hypothetical protein
MGVEVGPEGAVADGRRALHARDARIKAESAKVILVFGISLLPKQVQCVHPAV